MSISKNDFLKKGYGRIYVMNPIDGSAKLDRVREIVQGVDEYEWMYYPNGLIAPFKGKVELIYTGKFEACMDTITLRCWKDGLAVWCISQREDYFGEDRGAFRYGRTRRLCRGCAVPGSEREQDQREPGWTHVALKEGVGWVCRECNNNGHWEDREIVKADE